jgi:hypothetical protein
MKVSAKKIVLHAMAVVVIMLPVVAILLTIWNYGYGFEGNKKIKLLYCEDIRGFEVCVFCIEGYKYVVVDKDKRMNWSGMGITQMFEDGSGAQITLPVKCK